MVYDENVIRDLFAEMCGKPIECDPCIFIILVQCLFSVHLAVLFLSLPPTRLCRSYVASTKVTQRDYLGGQCVLYIRGLILALR